MAELHAKNVDLESLAKEKEALYENTTTELEQKKLILDEVTAINHEEIDELNDEIHHLRNSVQHYERETLAHQESQAEYEKNIKFIFDLTQEFESK